MTIKFKFYVLNYNHNKNVVEMFNIFQNIHVQEYTEKIVKKYLRNPKKFSHKPFGKDEEVIYGFDALVREIDSIIAWQEKGRSEYECSCGKVSEKDYKNMEKIDCYYQAHANIEAIVYEVIRQYKEQIKGAKNEPIKRY